MFVCSGLCVLRQVQAFPAFGEHWITLCNDMSLFDLPTKWAYVWIKGSARGHLRWSIHRALMRLEGRHPRRAQWLKPHNCTKPLKLHYKTLHKRHPKIRSKDQDVAYKYYDKRLWQLQNWLNNIQKVLSFWMRAEQNVCCSDSNLMKCEWIV